jgi:hypothetical protein
MLKAGHHGVALTDDEWRVIYTWIDLNAPFWGTWTDFVDNWCYGNGRNWGMRTWPANCMRADQKKKFDRSHERRRRGEKLYQGWWNPLGDPELDAYSFADAARDLAAVKFEPPSAPPPAVRQSVVGARHPSGGASIRVELPGWKMNFRAVADGLYFAETELPHAAYAAFDPGHRNGFIDEIGKDHASGGHSLDRNPKLPAVRVSFDEAKAYCGWLSGKTGRRFRLPTEEEWEQEYEEGGESYYTEWYDESFWSVRSVSDSGVVSHIAYFDSEEEATLFCEERHWSLWNPETQDSWKLEITPPTES